MFASPLTVAELTVDDPFWTPRLRKLAEATLPHQFDQIANQTGRLRNFRRAASGESGGHEGRYYDDSDVYKWLEACAYALCAHPYAPLRAMADEVIDAIESCQMDDGYINTFFQLNHPDRRFENLSYLHEMYCMGHLIEAGVAWSEALGDRRLLEVSVRVAELLWRTFGPQGRPGCCGHEEVELALMRLGNHVGEPRYRELAVRMIELRGRKPSIFDRELDDPKVMELSPWASKYLNLRGDYFQDHAPIREHRDILGHAVRAMYLYIGAAQMDSDPALDEALRAVWTSMATRRMYITGGIGSTGSNEGFTADYDLPNRESYAETCASVGLALWGRALYGRFGDSEFMDLAERAIFNGALAGIDLEQTHYFYANPLESRGEHRRVPWFDCACCPPNIARLIGSIGTFAVSRTKDGAAVHFPVGGTYRISESLHLRLAGRYPWESAFTVTFEGKRPARMVLRVRIPDWCDEATFTLAGSEEPAAFDGGYAVFDRTWQPGETLEVDWHAEPRWVCAHPGALDDLGRLALTYGPLVMCLESHGDWPKAHHAIVDTELEVEAAFRADLLGGVITCQADVLRESPDFGGELYATPDAIRYEEGSAEFIPYFAWGNRGPSSMTVWVRGD